MVISLEDYSVKLEYRLTCKMEREVDIDGQRGKSSSRPNANTEAYVLIPLEVTPSEP